MRDRIEAVIRDKRGGWPTLFAGVIWEAVDIAGNAAFLKESFASAGLWEMLKHAVSFPPLLLVMTGMAWLIAAWRFPKRKPRKPVLVPRTDEEILALVDMYAGDGDLMIQIDHEERVAKTSVTLIKKAH